MAMKASTNPITSTTTVKLDGAVGIGSGGVGGGVGDAGGGADRSSAAVAAA